VFRSRALAIDLAAVLGVAVAMLAVAGHVFPNYDAFYALIWGSDLLGGRTPDFYAPGAPAPHPLLNAFAAVADAFGKPAAVEILRLSGPLTVGALCVGLFRLGEAVWDRQAGAVAAAIMFTREPTLIAGARSYVDVPTAALIVWAAVLEARRPRRGAPVLVLLALAGLLRPEVWLLSALYLAWVLRARGRADRGRLVALAASGPALWILSTLLITGTPLGPTHGAGLTLGTAPTQYGPTGLLAVPEAFVRSLGNFMSPIPLALAAAGIVVAFVLRRRAMLLPLTITLANSAAFAAVGLSGLPPVQRYLFPTAAMLSLFAGVAVVEGVRAARRSRQRTIALAAAVLLLALALVWDARRLDDARSLLASEDAVQADLDALVHRREASDVLRRARAVQLQNPRILPLLAYWTDRPPDAFASETPADAFLAARTPAAERYLVGRVGALPAPPPGAGIANASWALHVIR
jgi:hypothetical protein